MTSRYVLATLVASGALIAHAATQAPTEQAPTANTPTFRAATRLVQVNVIVGGKDGRPVPGLGASDFALFDAGKPQSIDLFSVQSNQRSSRGADDARKTGTQGPEFSNGVGPAGAGATVILIDRFNASRQDQLRVRGQLVKFLTHIRPEDRVAIYALDFGAVRVFQDFTSDAATLARLVARLNARRDRPPAEIGDPGVNGTGDVAMQRALESLPVPTRPVNTPNASVNAENRVDATADALAAIANRLAAVRGRKSVVWVSGGFPLTFSDAHSTDLLGADAVRHAIDALSDANVAVYPVDARGLTIGGAVTPAEVSPRPFNAWGPDQPAPDLRRPEAPSLSLTHGNIDSLQKLAEDTGGVAFFNSNDIMGAVRHAIDDGELTYLLGFYPSHGQWDGSFRDIKVTVDRPGVQVRYRKGYFALSRSIPSPEVRQGDLLRLADIPLEATAVGLSARVNGLDGQGHASGDVTVALRVDPGAITLQKTAEGWSGSLDLVIVQTVPSGASVKSFGGVIDFSMSDARRERFAADGLTLNRPVTIRSDARELRILVRDVASGATGSLIMPLR